MEFLVPSLVVVVVVIMHMPKMLWSFQFYHAHIRRGFTRDTMDRSGHGFYTKKKKIISAIIRCDTLPILKYLEMVILDPISNKLLPFSFSF